MARWGEALVLAVAGTAAEDALAQVGRDALRGKLVIDTTNPITDEPPEQGVLKYFTDPTRRSWSGSSAAIPRPAS